MNMRAQNASDGYTLAEVMVAVSLVLLLASGLYAAGLMVMRMTNFNRVAIEARALGLQELEELAPRGKQDLLLLMPISARTNFLQHGESVERTATITGHDSALATTTNLSSAAYLELRIDARYVSP